MSEAILEGDANPYSAPDAALDTGQDDLYQPKIFSFSGRIGRMRYLAYGIGVNFLLMAVMIPLGWRIRRAAASWAARPACR